MFDACEAGLECGEYSLDFPTANIRVLAATAKTATDGKRPFCSSPFESCFLRKSLDVPEQSCSTSFQACSTAVKYKSSKPSQVFSRTRFNETHVKYDTKMCHIVYSIIVTTIVQY